VCAACWKTGAPNGRPSLIFLAASALLEKAAEIKATYRLSVTDAWIAATAVLLNATLVHKDPEFEPLPIPQHRLLYKG